jgi:AmiR/NasT family two-component response regulator
MAARGDPVIETAETTDEVQDLRMRLDAAIQRVSQLEVALLSNRRIGAAMGILMVRHHMTETEAFEALRITSQHAHEKLSAVADAVILAGDLDPTLITHRPAR